MMTRQPDQWIFITGATSGIGKKTAEYIASKGLNVIATGRNQHSLKKLQEQARDNGWTLHAWKMDVTNSEDIKHAAKQAFELTNHEGIDVLINNAGFGQPGFLLDVPVEQARYQFEVNVFGLLEVTKTLAPQLIQKRGRKIINISSVLGKMPVPWMGIYTASKFAVEGISDVLRYELHPFGVKVVTVEPGAIATSFQTTTIEQMKTINTRTSYYETVYQWMEKTNYKALYTMPSGSPESVARIIYKIIHKKNPKKRYVVPLQARLFLIARKLLPHWIVDRITLKTFHLHETIRLHENFNEFHEKNQN